MPKLLLRHILELVTCTAYKAVALRLNHLSLVVGVAVLCYVLNT